MSDKNKTNTKIDTIETRTAIGFPSKHDWVESKANYTSETLEIAGHPVMESWEEGYMAKLASIATSKGGVVLEVGYGMGISAAEILKAPDLNQHHIIECHPGVIAKALEDLAGPISAQKVHIFQGFWEDIVPFLKPNIYDGILFDTYPLSEEEIHANHFWFFEEAYRLLKPGGILSYYSDEKLDFSERHLAKLKEAGFSEIDSEICKVSPPDDCEYWQSHTIMAPIIRKSS